jgi:hypothetical protein
MDFRVILVLVLLIGLSFGMGWLGVGYTKTVGKAQQNAETTVFRETQSFVEGKNQELLKYYREWKKASADDKKSIEATVRLSFSNISEDKILDSELQNFLKKCKYE